MALTNEYLTALVSILSIVSSLLGAIYFFYQRASEQSERLYLKLEAIEGSLIKLDKEMLRYSDPLLQNLLAAFNNRFDAIEKDVNDLNNHTQSTRSLPLVGAQIGKDLDDMKGLLSRHEKIIATIAMRKSDKF